MRRPPGPAPKRSRPLLAAALLFAVATGPARADGPADAWRPATVDGSTLTLERGRAPVGAALDGRPRDVEGFSYRWWLRSGPARFGIGVGALGPVTTAVDPAINGGPRLTWSAQTLTLGLRYRVGERSVVYADASNARPVAGEPAGELFAAKLGVEWAGRARSRFGFERGAFGMQLDSGYRMQLRVRHGGLGVYVRGQF